MHPMEFVIRLGTGRARSYPLPIEVGPDWVQADGGWTAHVQLPKIPKAHIIVPSFSSVSNPSTYRFSIGRESADLDLSLDQATSLMWVPRGANTAKPKCDAFSAHIDCWHSAKSSTAVVKLHVAQQERPQDELVVISVRPLDKRYRPTRKPLIEAPRPTPISQMMAPRSIAGGICSPTATAMALGSCWPQTIRACHDPRTRAFGCWPLAIHWGSQCGHIGAVEALFEWDSIYQVLSAGSPLVCSINFSKGDLTGAPQNQTGGHLVTLYGLTETKALVMDPAAKSHEEVAKEYDLKEFADAWLRQRGAAYIFNPKLCVYDI